MPDEHAPAPLAWELDERRAITIRALTDHFAQDRLTVEELEDRMDRAYRARTTADLVRVLDGLPAVETAAPATTAVSAPAGDAARWRNMVAFMSGVMRRGAWSVPSRLRAIAFMGSVELDLRHVELPPLMEIQALAIMGGIEITVPPGVRLESDGLAIMGGFEDQLRQPASADPHAPVVRVTGFSLMGGVEARVQPPD